MDRDKLNEDRKIDPEQLDVEATRQADLFFEWAEQFIEARTKMERLEFELDVLESRLQLDCREHPESYGTKSTTETAIKSAVKCSPKYVKAHQDFLDARREAGMLEKAVAAMDMKKRMLEELIKLHGQQYFAGPTEPRDLVGAYAAHQARRDSALGDRQKANLRRRVPKV